MKHAKLFIIFILFNISIAFSQPTNIAVIDSITTDYLSRLAQQLKDKGIDKTALYINEFDGNEYFEEMAVHVLDSAGIRISLDSATVLNFVINDISTVYSNTSDSDSLTRTIIIKIMPTLINNSGRKPLEVLEAEYSDRISRISVSHLNSGIYPFAGGDDPEPDLTFWEKYLEPAIVSTAAILTVILFFSVRSN